MPDNSTPEEKELSAHRQELVIQWRRERVPFAEIGRLLNPEAPYSKQWAHALYKKALLNIPALEVAQHRAEELELNDFLVREALAILERDHVAVSQGRVVREGVPYVDDDGKARIAEGKGAPILDDGPKLQAITTVNTLMARRAKYLGLDSAVKVEVDGNTTVNYKINGVDVEKMK